MKARVRRLLAAAGALVLTALLSLPAAWAEDEVLSVDEEAPVTATPATAAPAAEAPAAEAPATEEPAATESGAPETDAEDPAAQAEEALSEEPEAKTPAIKESAPEEAAKEPAAKEPAAKEPATEPEEGGQAVTEGDGMDDLNLDESAAPEAAAPEAAAPEAEASAPAIAPAVVAEPKQEAPKAEEPSTPKEEEAAVAPADEAVETAAPEAAEAAGDSTGDEPELEAVEEPEPAPAEQEVTIDEGGEASAAGEQAAGELSLDEQVAGKLAGLPSLKMPDVPRTEPPPKFKLPGRERAFQEFLSCGIPAQSAAGCRVSAVTGSPDADRYLSFRGTEVSLSGKLGRSKVLAAYRIEQGSCLARYVGMVVVTGEGPRTAGATASSRAYVLNSVEPIVPGDSLCEVDSVRKEYERQYSSPPRAADGPMEGTIICMADGRSFVDTRQRTVMVDRGRKDGVTPGWSCEFQAPGADGRTTYGRVIRADDATCFVQFMRLCEPVEIGRQVTLSGARTQAGGASAARTPAAKKPAVKTPGKAASPTRRR